MAISSTTPISGKRRQVTAGSAAEPFLSQAIAMAQQPIEANQRMGALDRAGVEHRRGLGQRLDDNPDVFLLLDEAVEPSGGAAVDPAAEQPDRLVVAAARRQHDLDRDQRPDQLEAGLLAHLAQRDLFDRL